VLCSIIARGGRFFVVAILLNRYGEWIRVRIENIWAMGGVGSQRAGARIHRRVSNALKTGVNCFAGSRLRVTLTA